MSGQLNPQFAVIRGLALNLNRTTVGIEGRRHTTIVPSAPFASFAPASF